MDETVFALEFSGWKRPFVRLCFPNSSVRFVRDPAKVPAGSALAIWGRRVPDDLAAGIRVFRIEDGFLRSVGLGSDLVRPLSWVVDDQGIYYDATRPSRLESILANMEPDAGLSERAAALCERIVASQLTKYNVGNANWQSPSAASRVVLVPGQVESDTSLAFGAPDVRRNIDLLRAVRIARPDAHVVYKPHPDVLAGMRRAGTGEEEARHWCDEVVGNVPMDCLLEHAHEVHVMTSLSGFEALLRGKEVICHGLPFYAGWGLTHDLVQCPRRERNLTLDQFVAGALIRYPVYFDREGKRRITPEAALDLLAEWSAERGGREPWWRGTARIILRRVVGVR
jgi:capsular polysaccharide export protein